MTVNIDPPQAAEQSDPPPDWATHAADVTCPLCGYNLRGLTEPRCPECGHAFKWRALLDESSWRHPYLFEHHPRRPVRSFARTFVASLRPRRFFGGNVRPEHTPRPRMLVLFWLLLALVTILAPTLALTAYLLPTIYEEHQLELAMLQRYRGAEQQRWKRLPPGAPFVIGTLRRYGSFQGYLDGMYPLPTFWQAARLRLMAQHRLAVPAIVKPALSLVVWPWLSFAALMLFPQTMHRHRVLPAQVFRVVVYSATPMFPLLLVALALPFLPAARDALEEIGGSIVFWRMSPSMIGALLLAYPVLSYRLGVGYRQYLRFSQPLATVLLAQLVVGLAWLAMFHWIVLPALG
jgi:hypothetical protein